MATITIRTWQSNTARKAHLVLEGFAVTLCGLWIKPIMQWLSPIKRTLSPGDLDEMSQSGAYCQACLKRAARPKLGLVVDTSSGAAEPHAELVRTIKTT